MPGWTITEWRDAFAAGLRPAAAIEQLHASLPPDDPAWILRVPLPALIARATQLEARAAERDRLPLYGIPFAVKDNLDVAGLPTTAACPEYAYVPETSAPAVQRLLDAGAILVGKTNLDQFATGLVGTRSPYGAVPNTFDARYIAGGSSSGSASVVARGRVPFALGTDTAGSGRVPAGFNNLVGLKPTRGAISARGMVPACRTLDCVSVFGLNLEDVERVHRLAAAFDAEDPWSRAAPPLAPLRQFGARVKLGVPARPQWFGDAQSEAAFAAASDRMQAMGVEIVPIDFDPLHETASLLYDGPWVAERLAALEPFLREKPQAMHPVVRGIVERGRTFSAVDAWRGEYRRAALKRMADTLMSKVDALLVPTTPTIYTIAEVDADPVTLNMRLGTYTNFVNLLDWCALSLPGGMRGDGLPFGITLIGPAWADAALVEFGLRWQRHAPWTLGATGRAMPVPEAPAFSGPGAAPAAGVVRLAVVGAHLAGMPLNRELTERGGVLAEVTATCAAYRLYALPGTVPPKPGLVRTGDGAPIAVELWDLSTEAFGSFVAAVPAPMGIGSLELADGRVVKGFICERHALEGAQDITSFGGWRAFVASRAGR